MTPRVSLDRRELAARPWLPIFARPGTFWTGPAGEVVRVEASGAVELLHQGATPWNRSIASSPAPRPVRP